MSFAEALCRRLKGQIIEVYSGDMGTTFCYAEKELSMKELIKGKLIDADGDLLILEVNLGSSSNLVYVNCWGVRACLVPTKDIKIHNAYVLESEKP